MFEQVIEYLQQNGFCIVGGNSTGLFILCRKMDTGTQVITLYRIPNGNELSLEQFLEIEQQIQQKFSSVEGHMSRVSFLCTKNTGAVSRLQRNSSNTGVIDLTGGRLFIYEGMSEEFLDVYDGIEACCFKESVAKKRAYKNQAIESIGKVNAGLVFLNLAIFIVLSFSHMHELAVDAGALSWFKVFKGHEWYRIITSMFLHAGISHLVNNMITLFLIGNMLERVVGSAKYLFLYLGSGILSAIASMGYHWYRQPHIESIGASGAIFGVVGAMLYIVLVNKGRVEDLGRKRMFLFVFLSLYGGFTASGVDNIAHVGGLIGGLLLAAVCYKVPKRIKN